ncbi:dihydrodipicolinate synthase family protein, partial [Nonlabens ulvanivorans]
YGLNGDVEEAFELHYKIAASIDMIFEQGNPGGIKSLLASLGLIEEYLRLPLVPVNENLKSRIDAFLKQYEA